MAPRCFKCKRTFTSGRSLKLHLSKSKECSIAWGEELKRELSPTRSSRHTDFPSDADQSNRLQDHFSASPEGSSEPLGKRHRVTVEEVNDEEAPGRHLELNSGNAAPGKRPRVAVEEVEDEEAPGRYSEPYPGNAAECLGTGPTRFHQVREEQSARGEEPWAPFADMEEWDLAKWIVNRVNQTGLVEFLELPIVSLTFCYMTYLVLTNSRRKINWVSHLGARIPSSRR
jgi:hypothetical protein